jgi:branched-chain amino acid aminotransferase
MFHFIQDRILSEADATLSVFDLAIVRGYGVFDFFKVLNGVPVFLDDHLKRFFYSSQKLRLQPPIGTAELTNIILELISKNELKEGSIKLILTGGLSSNGFSLDGKPTLLVLVGKLNFQVFDSYEGIKTLALKTLDYVRETPDIKSTNYMISMMHWDQIVTGGFDDFLFVKNHMVSESSRANFFMIDASGTLITPAVDVLHGITRNKILAIASAILPIEIRPISLSDVLAAKEAFLTSTTKQAMPVVRIDDQIIGNGQPGEMTGKLFEAFHQLEMDYIHARAAQVIA